MSKRVVPVYAGLFVFFAFVGYMGFGGGLIAVIFGLVYATLMLVMLVTLATLIEKLKARGGHPTAKVENPITFWDSYDMDGILQYETEHEAFEGLIDDMPHEDIKKNFEVEIVGWRRPVVTLDEGFVLEMLLENHLDEEYAGEEGPFEPTEAMQEAERKFVAVIQREYVPWIHDAVPGTEETVKALDYVKEYVPEWLCAKEGHDADGLVIGKGIYGVPAISRCQSIHLVEWTHEGKALNAR